VAGYPWEAVRNQASYAAVVSFKRLPQTTSPRTMLYEGWGAAAVVDDHDDVGASARTPAA